MAPLAVRAAPKGLGGGVMDFGDTLLLKSKVKGYVAHGKSGHVWSVVSHDRVDKRFKDENSFVPVSAQVFHALGVPARPVHANYVRLAKKRPECFASPSMARAHVEYTMQHPDLAIPATKDEYTLIIRKGDVDRAVCVELVEVQGRYSVRSAYFFGKNQLRDKLEKLARRQDGTPAVLALHGGPNPDPESVSKLLDGPRDPLQPSLLKSLSGIDEAINDLFGRPAALDFGDTLAKALSPDDGDPLWSPHESPFIRWLIEKWTATGMTKFGALQAELAKWVMGHAHVAGSTPTPRPPTSEFTAWTPAELKLTKAYLESLAPGSLQLDDWLLVVDYLYQRYCPNDVMTADAQMLAARAHVMGRVEANFAKMSEAQAASIASTAPVTAPDVLRAFPAMTEVQKATLEYGNAKCCEYVTQLTDNAREDMRKLIVDYQEQVALGGTAAPREALQTRLLDRFGTLNRDWRRIAITEAGNNALNGMISALPYGTKVKRIEQYRGACAFCKKWHEAVFEVVDPANPKKDGKTQIWIGKNNIGRSNSPRKKSGAGLVDRTEDEMYWVTVDLFHPNCRGRWVVVPGGSTELRKSKPSSEWNESAHPRLPDGTFANVGKMTSTSDEKTHGTRCLRPSLNALSGPVR